MRGGFDITKQCEGDTWDKIDALTILLGRINFLLIVVFVIALVVNSIMSHVNETYLQIKHH